ncbi:MAG TPA: 23S rRNA (adenine(2503)-C(2))-methyltransferase RlmN [Rhodospirillaceae bacterium]|nr:23S rRNA (adenine(2503)-C(2))-methyltransferase RlmN [Rhodospirillaceae bacterium]
MSDESLKSHAARFTPTPLLIDGKRNLIGLTLAELKSEMETLGLEPFRAKQLWAWIYCHGVRDFEKMTNLGKSVRAKLAKHFVVWRPTIKTEQISVDGSRKWLMAMADGHEIEAVYIPEEDRGSLCVSSQIGCTNKCSFCHTGTMRLVRNLNASEILMQVMHVKDVLGEWGTIPKARLLSNIVIMGMGEPLFNYEPVAKAVKLIMDEEGISIGRRKITLSTSGVVPMIKRCGEELGINLAISLHAVTNELRNELIPLNKKYPIEELLQACRDYPAASNARRITFEYVMLKGINDGPADAKELVRLLRGIPAKINLLPYNPWPGSPYESSDDATIQKFGDYVNAAGYASPIRTPRGRDIMAACGQLKSASQKEKKKEE